ncbi:MAG: glycosyltransferase [Deinococcus-Thermus bacterium]|jgi:glycosyltransferase involved in cell wall biosynthesis|nr:glycosyltransferase [Deinococcota bacterium]
MHVLTLTNMYPSAQRPAWGSFVGSQVVSLRRLGLTTDVLVVDGYKSRLNYLRMLRRYRAAAASGRYRLAHVHYGTTALVAVAAPGLPFVLSFCGDDLYGHSDNSGRAGAFSRRLVSLHKLAARRAAGIIVKSERMKALLPVALQPRTTVVPNGVDFERFRPVDRAEARRRLGLGRDRRYVLFPYAVDRPRKNFALLADAVATLRRRGHDVEPLVVSERPPEDVVLALNAADALALTSFWEGSPNAVKEAMACNLPVVSVDVGDVREVIGRTDGCAVVDAEADAFATALEAVFSTNRRTRGRDAVAHLDIDAVAARVRDVYAAALARVEGAGR